MSSRLYSLGIILSILFVAAGVVFAADESFIVQTLVGDDTTPPTVPTGLTATSVAQTQIDLSWNPSTDDWLLSGYQVFRNEVLATTSSFAQIATTTATTYSDVGLTASTTYEYYVTAFDSSLNISSSSATATATTLSPPAPPATTTEATSNVGGRIDFLEMRSLEVIPGTDSAIIRYRTLGYVRSVIRWGQTASFELGSLAEGSFTKEHETRISGLTPGTRYWFTIVGEDNRGEERTLTTDTFTTLPPDDVFPPANVENLRVYRDGEDVVLEWVNPEDADFEKVRVLRSEYFFPSDTADGWFVYEGTEEGVRDKGAAVPGTRQYYTVFSYDELGNISSGAVVAIDIPGSGTTGEPSGGGEVSIDEEIIDEEQNPIDLSFSDLQFVQEGQYLTVHNSAVVVDGSKQLTILLPYDAVPEHLKTILVVLRDAEDRGKTFSFLLRIDAEKDAYTATLAPLSVAGTFPLTLSVFDYQTSQVGVARGEVISEITHLVESDDSEGGFVSFLVTILMKIFTNYFVWFALVLAVLLLVSRKLIFGKREQQGQRT